MGGEPPDGTSDEMPRIPIRDRTSSGRLHSKNTLKIDIMAFRDGILLLIELKSAYDNSDKVKLVTVTTSRKNDLLSAIEERTSIKRHQITQICKCLGFSKASEFPILDDFVIFQVSKTEDVTITKGKNICQMELM